MSTGKVSRRQLISSWHIIVALKTEQMDGHLPCVLNGSMALGLEVVVLEAELLFRESPWYFK